MSADQQPKYLNTSENAIFHKGSQLFGLHLARSAAAKSGVVVLVEGYTDVVALHQIGIQHVVALMGTAMTPEQVAELARLARCSCSRWIPMAPGRPRWRRRPGSRAVRGWSCASPRSRWPRSRRAGAGWSLGGAEGCP